MEITEPNVDQGNPRERQILFKRYNKGLKSVEELANFKEPVALIRQRNGKVRFVDNLTSSKYVFTHTDGTRRFILLDPNDLWNFNYGKGKSFRGYILHEDCPTSKTDDVVISTEKVGDLVESITLASEKWKLKDWEGKTKAIKAVAYLVLAIGVAIALYFMFAPAVTNTTTTVVEQVATNMTENISTGITKLT